MTTTFCYIVLWIVLDVVIKLFLDETQSKIIHYRMTCLKSKFEYWLRIREIKWGFKSNVHKQIFSNATIKEYFSNVDFEYKFILRQLFLK